MKQKSFSVNEGCPLVLVADDYEDGRSTLRLWLEQRGYRVVEATNGCEAVEVATRERPDLILMDISMPVLDGCAAMRRIRENEEARDVPIIAISAHEYACLNPLLRIDAIRAGLTEYIAKPFDPVKLENLLGRLLPAG
jgi:CheY-like chemotaxis protein